MKKKITIWAWFLAVVALGVVLFLIAGSYWVKKAKFPEPRPDAIATTTASGGDVLIENKTAGYVVMVPQSWRLEKTAGSGVTLYPHYSAKEAGSPGCKIEISTLPNPDRENLSVWLTAYLHNDPTADVSEASRVAMTVSGELAIVWRGILNDVPSMLAYIAGGSLVYEVAPSVVAPVGNGAPLTADCESALRTILKNFQFTK